MDLADYSSAQLLSELLKRHKPEEIEGGFGGMGLLEADVEIDDEHSATVCIWKVDMVALDEAVRGSG